MNSQKEIVNSLCKMIHDIGDKDECSSKCLGYRLAAIIRYKGEYTFGPDYYYPGNLNDNLKKIVDTTFDYIASLYKNKEEFWELIPNDIKGIVKLFADE